MRQPAKKKQEGCPDCRYWRDCGGGMKACHFTIDTGMPRNLSYEDCYKKRGTPYRKREANDA